ncbi:hypothetical protein D3C84_1195200 [compost metagenome]
MMYSEPSSLLMRVKLLSGMSCVTTSTFDTDLGSAQAYLTPLPAALLGDTTSSTLALSGALRVSMPP